MQPSSVISLSSARRASASAASAPDSDGSERAFAARIAAALCEGSTAARITLYRGLSLFPDPRALVAVAAHAVRLEPRPVFEALAHHNPYPAAHFDDGLWNEMVLRAVRLGCRLAPIEGLDERRNDVLADLLVAHVRSRRAARRSVNPEVWRCIGPFAAEEHFDELVQALRSGVTKGRMAAALALAECPTPDALTVLEGVPMLWHEIRHGRMWWDRVA